MAAFYNEIDPKAAAWLRELIKVGAIAPGVVDERDIRDIRPSELAGYTQCHFFAGIGVWSHALRLAGWPDDRRVWTGSCPCQPFSAAGRGAGFDDERHLWPAFHHLISQCKPPVVFGEQVASKAVDPWIDFVCADLEAVGYAFGAVAFPAAGVGAPHIRDRTYWMGDSNHEGPQGLGGSRTVNAAAGREDAPRHGAEAGVVGGVADTPCGGRREEQQNSGGCATGDGARETLLHAGRGCVGGHWGSADWIFCRDNKYRPVEPGTFPLAHGSPARVGRLRGYGNAIVAQAAEAFVASYLEAQR